MTYIYRITNNINGKTYIGQHTLPNYKNPRNDRYMGSGSDLKIDQRLYGMKNFSKEILTCIFGDKNKHYTNLAEIYYIKQERDTKGFENVYNISDGGTMSNAGQHISEEQKKAISKKLKGKCGKLEAKDHYLNNYLNSSLGSIEIVKLMAKDGFKVGKSSICAWRKEAKGTNENGNKGRKRPDLAEYNTITKKGSHWHLENGHRVYEARGEE